MLCSEHLDDWKLLFWELASNTLDLQDISSKLCKNRKNKNKEKNVGTDLKTCGLLFLLICIIDRCLKKSVNKNIPNISLILQINYNFT